MENVITDRQQAFMGDSANADYTQERTWLVFGSGKPRIRLLKEAEPVSEVEALAAVDSLNLDAVVIWDRCAGRRWVVRLTATEYDLLDVLTADKRALVIGYVAQGATDETEIEIEIVEAAE